LDKPADWTPYLTVEQLEAMAATWIPLQLELTKRCKEAIHALDEPAQLEARRQLSDILKRLTREIRPHNRGMLAAMAAALGRIAGDEHAAGASVPVLVSRT
jgi:hypothetical protein